MIEALFIWVDNLDPQFFTDRVKVRIQEKVKEKDFYFE